tara:strand:- start:58 stop:249 length:192 start_codon:yes stop_codon:yes gene_type:complete
MANIYDENGNYLAQGLQGCNKCDEAWQSAVAFARQKNEDVILEDDDGDWLIDNHGRRTDYGLV